MNPNGRLILAALLIGIVVLTFAAPEEATLGTAMRWVYVHVALIWSGLLMLTAAGLAGAIQVIRPVDRLGRWIATTELVAVGLFALGFVFSLVSAATSWGGVLWQEPRILSSIIVVGMGLAAVYLMRVIENPRVVGGVALLFMILAHVNLAVAQRIFHPDSPIGTSESTIIKATFFGMTVLTLALGIVVTRMIGPASELEEERSN